MYYADDRTTGRMTYNTAIGYEALRGSTTAANNTGQSNTSVGYQSLYSNTSGYSNTANGYRALYSNTTGNNNTANGCRALYSNTTGNNNTANGYLALYSNTTGNSNTANGFQALSSNTDGNSNTANGVAALYSNTNGTNNTALGYDAFSTGSSYTNSTGIGYDAEPGADNRVKVGNTSVTSIGGQVGWTNFSDGRIKTNVQENVAGLNFIMKLRPVTYHFDKDKQDELMGVVDSSEYAEKYDIEKIQFSGFIAQEVEQAAQEIGYDFSGVDKSGVKNGGLYGLRYAEFVVPMVKAMQEQQEIIEKQQQTIEELLKRVDDLEKKMNE